MPRFKRIVVVGCPHHISSRGNRRQPVFFSDEDRKQYLRLLGIFAARYGLIIWAYCLMVNHVHLAAVPEKPDSMHLTIREVHRRYSLMVNLLKNWKGSLWQERYFSFPLEGVHLYRALRYIENNPVREGIVKYAEDYPWSSAPAHVFGSPNALLAPNGLKLTGRQWKAYLRKREEEEEIKEIRAHIQTGRPLGGKEFLAEMEDASGRDLQPKKPGRKKRFDLTDESHVETEEGSGRLIE